MRLQIAFMLLTLAASSAKAHQYLHFEMAEAVRYCWEFGPLPPEAMGAKIKVTMEIDDDHEMVPNSIRLIEKSGADDAVLKGMFATAKAAMLRCLQGTLPVPNPVHNVNFTFQMTAPRVSATVSHLPMAPV